MPDHLLKFTASKPETSEHQESEDLPNLVIILFKAEVAASMVFKVTWENGSWPSWSLFLHYRSPNEEVEENRSRCSSMPFLS
jgi:hypothetical protein